MTTGKTIKLKSSRVKFGKRTIFFDLNLSKNDKKYLRITESQFIEEGKDRVYNSFVLFPETIQEFQKQLTEMAASLS